jgi:hypothetical protein
MELPRSGVSAMRQQAWAADANCPHAGDEGCPHPLTTVDHGRGERVTTPTAA